MTDIRNSPVNNYKCIYHSVQSYVFRMKNMDLDHNQKCVCIFIHTTLTIQYSKTEKLQILRVFRPQILDM